MTNRRRSRRWTIGLRTRAPDRANARLRPRAAEAVSEQPHALSAYRTVVQIDRPPRRLKSPHTFTADGRSERNYARTTILRRHRSPLDRPVVVAANNRERPRRAPAQRRRRRDRSKTQRPRSKQRAPVQATRTGIDGTSEPLFGALSLFVPPERSVERTGIIHDTAAVCLPRRAWHPLMIDSHDGKVGEVAAIVATSLQAIPAQHGYVGKPKGNAARAQTRMAATHLRTVRTVRTSRRSNRDPASSRAYCAAIGRRP